MRRMQLIVAGLMLAATASAAGTPAATIGDGKVDGSKLKPYEYTWHQSSFADGKWVYGGTLTERVSAIEKAGKRVLQIEQITNQPNGTRVTSTSYVDHATLAPMQIHVVVYGPDRTRQQSATYELGPDGFTGTKTTKGQRETVSGKVTSESYSGTAFGLSLATLNLEDQLPIELPAAMIAFDANYRVIATDAGQKTLSIGGKQVEAVLVDVEWHHLELGDVYPGGPDASGGRYWIVTNPPDDVPYGPRYKTDSYAIEIEPETCRSSSATT